MTFAALVAGALLLFAAMDRFGATPLRRVLFWTALAGATLTKGPAGLLLPLLVIVTYAATAPPTPGIALRARAVRVREVFAALGAVPGLAAVLAVVAAWYAAGWLAGGDAFLEVHALRENVFRVIDADRFDSGHSHGFFYLFGQFLLGAFPWSLCAPAIAWWLVRERPLDDTRRFLVVWIVVTFAVFLVPDSKRGVYLLPAYPAGALLFGLVLGPGPEGSATRRLAAWGWTAGCTALALLGLAGLLVATGLPVDGLIQGRLRPHEAVEVAASLAALREQSLLTAGASVLVLATAAVAAISAWGAHWLRASVPMAVAFAAALGALVAPVERAIATTRSLALFLPRVNAKIGDAEIAFAPGSFDYGAVFYARRPIPRDEASHRRVEYLLAFEGTEAAGASPEEIVLRSEGTGARGRARLLLLRTPDG
jgi:4-amino-4-deoxy-L-arabinose transferase-like glycosyltransferase